MQAVKVIILLWRYDPLNRFERFMTMVCDIRDFWFYFHIVHHLVFF
jgi:hypothetical protein